MVLSIDVSVKMRVGQRMEGAGKESSIHIPSLQFYPNPLSFSEFILMLQVVLMGMLSISEILSPQEKCNLEIENC